MKIFNKKKALALLLSATMAVTIAGSSISAMAIPASSTEIAHLRVNYMENPLGIDKDDVRFSWAMDSNLIGQSQKAYQVVVTKDSANGPVVWDSGRVEDDKSVAVRYGGPALELETRYYWTVSVTDAAGTVTKSAPSYFDTGCDFTQADWIVAGRQEAGAPMFRTQKTLSKSVESAKLYISSLGIYNAYVNGQEVLAGGMDDTFNPGWTDYFTYVNYQTYDITDYIDDSELAIGVMVGNGWYAGNIGAVANYQSIGDPDVSELALIAKAVVTYTDGTKEVICTNPTDWKSSDESPVLSNDFFDGTTYDARIAAQVAGWNDTGYDVSDWDDVSRFDYTAELRPSSKAAAYVDETTTHQPIGGEDCFKYSRIEKPVSEGGTSEYATGHVVKQPVDTTGEIKIQPGETLILDMGQNKAGVMNLTASAAAGTTMKIRHAEMLNDGKLNPEIEQGGSDGPRGSIYTVALTSAKVTDQYTFAGTGDEVFEPDFTFHGFRYVEVTADAAVTIKRAESKTITSVTDQTGYLETSDPSVNQLVQNTLWSQRSNYLSIPTDCPQRAERVGWTGDAQLFAQTGLYNFDTTAFFENYIDIMNQSNRNNGGFYSAIMPTGFVGFFASMVSCGWSDAGVIIPWTVYQQTGDLATIEKSYEYMASYMQRVYEQGYSTPMFGDWLGLYPASTPYLNAVYEIYSTQLMEEMAGLIGRTEDSAAYAAKYLELKEKFMAKYVDEDGNVLSATADGGGVSNHGYPYIDNAQTALLWALKCGLYDTQAQKETYVENLVRNIKNENGAVRPEYGENTLSVGFLGVNVLLPILSEVGEAETAYALLMQDELPSWLYSVKNGATTIWERWNSYSVDNSFGDAGMNSFNHYSYGACLEWMYQYMAGIKQSETAPGFKEFVLQPTVDPQSQITYANGRYESNYGEIVSNWTADGSGNFTSYSAVVPANTTATLYLPVSAEAVSDFQGITGVTFLGMTTNNGQQVAAFSLSSGGFDFSLQDGKLSVAAGKGYVAPTQADKTILSQVIAYAQTQKDADEFDNVIPMVQESFTEALENAKSVNTNLMAGQEEVDGAWKALMNEIHKLGFVKGSKTNLNTLIEVSESYNLDNYVEQGKAEFTAALATAKTVYHDGNAMQDEVDSAASELLTAMVNLRLRADKSLLEKTLAETEVADLSGYTRQSVDAYSTALAEAEAVLADVDLTESDQDVVNRAADNLKAAYDALTRLDAGQTAPAAGDTALSTSGRNAKTGETSPIAVAVAVAALAATAFVGSKKRK